MTRIYSQSVGENLQQVKAPLWPGLEQELSVWLQNYAKLVFIYLGKGRTGPTSGTILPLSGEGLGRTWSSSIKRVASRQAAPPKAPTNYRDLWGHINMNSGRETDQVHQLQFKKYAWAALNRALNTQKEWKALLRLATTDCIFMIINVLILLNFFICKVNTWRRTIYGNLHSSFQLNHDRMILSWGLQTLWLIFKYKPQRLHIRKYSKLLYVGYTVFYKI